MGGGIPICAYESKLGMFRILHSKGKSLSSGGYGVTRPTIAMTAPKSTPKSKQTIIMEQKEYLFAEEATYLHERGLLQVLDETQSHTMTTQELYTLMNSDEIGIPLAVYLTYSHLRSQTFIVIRHTVRRLEIVLGLMTKAKQKSKERDDCMDGIVEGAVDVDAGAGKKKDSMDTSNTTSKKRKIEEENEDKTFQTTSSTTTRGTTTISPYWYNTLRTRCIV